MKDPKDRATGDLLEKRGPGRPRKDRILSAAERARRYRLRRKLNGGAVVTFTAEELGTLIACVKADLKASDKKSDWAASLRKVLSKLT